MKFLNAKKIRGFSLIQLMVSTILGSILVAAFVSTFKESSNSLSEMLIKQQAEEVSRVLQKLFKDDLQIAVSLRLGCDAALLINCNDIPVKSGMMPLPNVRLSNPIISTPIRASDIHPASLSGPTEAFGLYDGIRIAAYDDLANDSNCRIAPRRNGFDNPSTTEAAFWVDENSTAGCNAIFRPGALLVAMHQDATSSTSSIFQVTQASRDPGLQLLKIETSDVSIFNQRGGLRTSGFRENTRLLPIKFIEWMADATGRLYRREIRGGRGEEGEEGGALQVPGGWRLMAQSLDGLHFYPRTLNAEFARTFSETTPSVEETAPNDFNPMPDVNALTRQVLGVTVRFVVKSTQLDPKGRDWNNPLPGAPSLMPGSEQARFIKAESRFFVFMNNRMMN